MQITGRVENGSGRNSRIARRLAPGHFDALGYTPYPGSLNIGVTREERDTVRRLPGVRIGADTYRPATLNGTPCHLHISRAARTIEIIHPQRLRDTLNNGDPVTVHVEPPRPMRLSAVIMAHPTRRHAVEELQTELDRDAPVIYDTNPVSSADPEQRWATGKRAWEAHDPNADWHLVLQDDITVAADLIAGAEQALTQVGTEGLVSLYCGTGRPDQRNVQRMIDGAQRKGHTWGSLRSLSWGPAIAAPIHTINDMLEWCSDPATKHKRPRNDNYDYRVGVYYRDVLGYRTWYPQPSLVEHRGLPSLIGHDTGDARSAHTFHSGSALDVDWTQHDGLNPYHG